MNGRLAGSIRVATFAAAALAALALSRSATASIAYGSINNFDCVNDTGVEAHGFEIELDDVLSTDVTYTYDYNHYGVPKITQDSSDAAHPKVFVRYAATRTAGGGWSAYTAIPSGPINPTDGHQFTDPTVNFGGEHFGVGYYGTPTAVKYNWLVDDGAGNLVHGPAVYIATPTFNYAPPAPLQPAVVQAVIVLPPPEIPPALQFGEATWVMDIKTSTHNAGKVELRDLVDPDPDDPTAPDWTNGEPAEIETEWRLLQTEFAHADNPKGVLEGVPEELPGGDEVVTRRYEFYNYVGPFDAETGEAMADQVAADGIHGVGSATFATHFDPDAGEWIEESVDLSTMVVVGDFIGAQMAAFDAAPALGLIDHVPDGDVGVAYADRTVVIAGPGPFVAALVSGSLPAGTTFEGTTGVFSGTPTVAGVFTFTIEATDLGGVVSKSYTVTIAGEAPPPVAITTSASPADGGTTGGDGVYDVGGPVTVTATANAGFLFVDWTDGGAFASSEAAYTFAADADRSLVANFVHTYVVATSVSPAGTGTTGGDGTYIDGTDATVTASPGAGYMFVGWTEGGAPASSTAAYTFAVHADRTLVAEFLPDHPVLRLTEATAVRTGSKVDVTFGVENLGGVTAQSVAVRTKKDAMVDGKAMNERAPCSLGDIASLGSATCALTFTGVKAGTRTFEVTLTHAGGTETLSIQTSIP